MYGWVNDCAVGYLVLVGQALQGVYRGLHSVHSEEGRQVGRVHRSYSEREEPPESANDSTYNGYNIEEKHCKQDFA